jgi:hypothetical protein
VLVKKANRDTGNIGVTYPVGAGAPVMVLGGGGGSQRGKTMRQRVGGALGGLVGVAGALTGQHRSLGGLTQSMISGGAQGRQLGEALGRFASGRGSKAKANLRQTVADKHADAKASGEFDRYGVNAGRNAFTRFGHDRMSQSVYDLEQAKQAEKNAMAEERERAMAEAKAFGADEGGRKRQMAEDLENFVKVTGMDPARASEFMSQFAQRINVMQEQQASDDPVQAATDAAQANPIQAASKFNSVPQPTGGANKELVQDETLENNANYGAEAIDDEIDVEEQTQTPQGEASELSDAQKRVIEESLKRSQVKVRRPQE